MSIIRSKTVEPVLGTLLNFIGMKRVNTRGIAGANKHVLMSALTYNLKKLLKWNRKKVVAAAVVLRRPDTGKKLTENAGFWLENMSLEGRTRTHNEIEDGLNRKTYGMHAVV